MISPKTRMNTDVVPPPIGKGAVLQSSKYGFSFRVNAGHCMPAPKLDKEFDSEYDEAELADESRSDSETADESDGTDMVPSDARPPRVALLDLPTEIIDCIASSMGDQLPILDAAGRYIEDRYTPFSTSRFWLLSLLRVCSTLRRTVERVMYRDIHVDFTGWKGRKQPTWPAASLRLLLRTLNDRPELARYVQTAALDYQLCSESEALEAGLTEFLTVTPNLTTLFLAQCPLVLWDLAPLQNITTFATTYAPGILPSILDHFPRLKRLHMRDCHIMYFSPVDLPSQHQLRAVRLDSNQENAVSFFCRALHLCADSVQDLDIRFIGSLLRPSPPFLYSRPLPQTISLGENLRSLRLDNLSIFKSPNSGFCHLLRRLPALERLQVSNHACFHESAFAVLPSTLRTLRVTDFYGFWDSVQKQLDDNSFLEAMVQCIQASARRISMIVASCGEDPSVHDFSPVAICCASKEIVFRTDTESRKPFLEISFAKT